MATLRCPVLIGRQAELAALSAALDAARGGTGSTLVVLGQPGIGKSRLVNQFVNDTRSGGAAVAVLVGRAVGDGQAAAFRPLVEALLAGLRSGAVVDEPELRPFAPALGRLLPQFRTAAGAADISLVVLGEAVLRLLRVLSGGSGLLIVLEDLQWFDPDTLSVVEYLSDNISTEPVLLLLTARSGAGRNSAFTDRLADRGVVRPIELNPLVEGDVTRVVSACLDDEIDHRLLSLIHSRAEGVPLVIEELLTLAGTDPSMALVPASVAALTRARLDALPRIARRTVYASAVLGERFDWTLLPATTGLDAGAVLECLRAAITVDLLTVGSSDDEFRFRHALTRDAALDALLPPERSALARRALDTLHSTHPELDGHWCDLAANLASLAGDDAEAASLLVEMGRRDVRRGALATAETALQRAISLAKEPALTADATEVLAEVFVLAGKPQQAADVTALLISALVDLDAAPSRRADAHLRLARAWTVAGQWDAASHELVQARALAGANNQMGPQADLVDALTALGRKQYDHAEQLARSALNATEYTGPFEVSCEALEILGRLARRTHPASAEDIFQRASETALVHHLPLWHVRALHELSTLDLLNSLRLDRIEQAREAALQLGALAVATDADHHQTAAHYMRGELEAGLLIAERSTRAARRLHLPSVPTTLMFQAGLRVMRGETPAAEALIAEALTFGADNPRLASEAWNVRGMRWLLGEDRRRALDAFDRSMEFLRQEQEPIAPPIGQWALLATLERSDEAIHELNAMPGIRVARWNDGQLGYAEAIQLGRLGERLAAEQAFSRADYTMTSPVPIPFYRHVSRRLVAEAAIRDHWGNPARWLAEDLTYFQTAGHDRVAAACRGLLRRAGAHVPRSTPGPPVPNELRLLGVTGREMDVLNQVSDGLSNREIAARLFLSPRTVEKHIENLLTKTGMPTRTALIAKAARDNW